MARLIGTIALVIALSSAVAAAQALTAADAGAFMGTWVLTLDSPQGPFEQNVVLKEEGGKVVAEITSQMQPDVQKVTDITQGRRRSRDEVRRQLPGQPVRRGDHMTPDGTDKAKVTFDVNGGQFTMSGTGTQEVRRFQISVFRFQIKGRRVDCAACSFSV